MAERSWCHPSPCCDCPDAEVPESLFWLDEAWSALDAENREPICLKGIWHTFLRFWSWIKFPCEDLVKIWLRLDTWTAAARRLEGQALYGAGLGAAPTVESLGRSLQVLKTRRTSRCIGVSKMVTWSTHWIHQVLTSWLLSFDDDLLSLHWWLGFAFEGLVFLVFGCQNCIRFVVFWKLHRRPWATQEMSGLQMGQHLLMFPFKLDSLDLGISKSEEMHVILWRYGNIAVVSRSCFYTHLRELFALQTRRSVSVTP